MAGFNWSSLALPVAIGAQGVAMGAQAKAAIEAGAGEAKSHLYNAAVEDERRAEIAATGSDAERQQRRLVRILLGESRAKAGASGIAISGQTQDILNEDAIQAKLDVLQIRRNTKREMRASAHRSALDRMQAKTAFQSGKYAARATLLTGGAGMAQTIAGTL